MFYQSWTFSITSLFFQHVLGPGEDLDIHVRPQWHQCDPCHIRYDFIGKLDTAEEDTRHILRRLGLRRDPLREDRHEANSESSSESTVRLVCQLPRDLVKELIELYRFDFEAFGYDAEKYLQCSGAQ